MGDESHNPSPGKLMLNNDKYTASNIAMIEGDGVEIE